MMGMVAGMPMGAPLPSVVLLVAGLALLVAGRRLFWLFVGLAGFFVGLQTAPLLLGPQPLWLIWIVGLAFGVIGALLALFFQQLAIAVGGFMAGSAIAVQLAYLVWGHPGGWTILIGGIIGAVGLFLLFDWALIVLSAMAGAVLIVQAVAHRIAAGPFLFLLLAGVGTAVQAGWLLAGRRRKE
jgi:hypothetical protein